MTAIILFITELLGKRGYGLIDFSSKSFLKSFADHPYFKTEKTFFNHHKMYLGFWALVSEYFKGDQEFQLDVFENQSEVFSDMNKYKSQHSNSDLVNLYNKSIVEGDFSNYDLAFIDPTYGRKDGAGDDWQKVVDLCKKLDTQNCSFALWYPVYNADISMKLWEKLGARSLELSWDANKEFKYASGGSGILLSNDLFTKVEKNIELYRELTSLLKGQLSIK